MKNSLLGSKLVVWRTFIIGGIERRELQSHAMGNGRISEESFELMRNTSFRTLPLKQEVDTVRLKLGDLGFEKEVKTSDFLNSAFLAEWSGQHADRVPEGYVLDLLPSEIGPHILWQCGTKSGDSDFKIAMTRIPNSSSVPCVFWVIGVEDRELFLYVHEALDFFEWFPDEKFLFWLRKKTPEPLCA